MKTKVFTTLFFVMALGLLAFAPFPVFAENETPTDVMEIDPEKYYLFVATGCPHCENVEKYMGENDIQTNFSVEIYDIAVEIDKQDDLLTLCRERVSPELADSYCGGVPEMIHGDNIYIGEDEIINHFKTEGYTEEPVDWGKWVVVGLLGGAVLVVTGLIAYPLIVKK